jgi:hypothetical protein
MQSYNFDGYTLTLEETNRRDTYNHIMVKYSFISPQDEAIFSGEDFGASPLHDAEGIESAKSLLGFLTLKKGDTDEDYFENYTPRQLEFSESFDCERLQLYTLEGES